MLNIPSFVSCAKVQKWLTKGGVSWIVVVENKVINDVNIHKVPIVNEFLDVFPKELLRLPPN